MANSLEIYLILTFEIVTFCYASSSIIPPLHTIKNISGCFTHEVWRQRYSDWSQFRVGSESVKGEFLGCIIMSSIVIFFLIELNKDDTIGPDTFLAGYRIPGWITGYFRSKNKYCHKFFHCNTLGSVRMSVCPSKRPYVYMSVRPSICNVYEFLQTYCTKNIWNYALSVKRVLFVKCNVQTFICIHICLYVRQLHPSLCMNCY